MSSPLFKQIYNESKSKISSSLIYLLIAATAIIIITALASLLQNYTVFSFYLVVPITIPFAIAFYLIYTLKNHYGVYIPLGTSWKTFSTSGIIVNLFYSLMFALISAIALLFSTLWFGATPKLLPLVGSVQSIFVEISFITLFIFVICLFIFTIIDFVITNLVCKRYLLTLIFGAIVAGIITFLFMIQEIFRLSLSKTMYSFLSQTPGVMTLLAIVTMITLPLNYLLGHMRGAKR